jgi:hypothetical protein
MTLLFEYVLPNVLRMDQEFSNLTNKYNTGLKMSLDREIAVLFAIC